MAGTTTRAEVVGAETVGDAGAVVLLAGDAG
jgi:hypothetical protein